MTICRFKPVRVPRGRPLMISDELAARYLGRRGVLITDRANIESMSCYLRHLDDVVSAAGVKLVPENRKEVDRTIKELLGESDCPDVWIEVKKRLLENEHGFVADLHEAFLMNGLL